MKPWDAGYLRVNNNHRYLQNGNHPFFYLADTAWLLFQQTDERQARLYLKNRREKGFTVIQCMLIHELPGMRPSNQSAREKDAGQAAYWAYVDRVLTLAEEQGLYMALVPAWGSVLQSNVLTADNMPTYLKFLAERYRDRPNIIWLLGGDIRGDSYLDIFKTAGETLRALCPNQLIGYHPFGRTSSSQWFHGETWLDFNMFQSGHRRYDQASLGAWDQVALTADEFFGEDNWRYAAHDLALQPPKPTVDGEPSYEQILQGLHDLSQPYWREWDVRRYAYWSVFAGSMGHAYGDNSIQQFFDNPRVPGSFGVRYVWQDAMHHVGAEQMGIMRHLMESVDYQNGCPAQELLLSPVKEKYGRVSLFAGPGFLFAYDYLGEAFTVDLSPFANQRAEAYWMNPVSGAMSYFGDFTDCKQATVKPVARFTQDNDWVLVIKAEA